MVIFPYNIHSEIEEYMGQRFYEQQLKTLGDCPGNKNPNKRTRKVAWDDYKKAEAVTLYEAASPTPETSMEIVKDIAEELDESPNGVRMILTKAGVYVNKPQQQSRFYRRSYRKHSCLQSSSSRSPHRCYY